MPILPDQSDLIAANERLTKEVASLIEKANKAAAELATTNASLATITAERDQNAADLTAAKASLASVTKELADAKAAEAAATAKVTKLEAEKVEFDKAVASKVAEMGITGKAVPAAASAPASGKKLTLTELCLASQ